MDHEAKLAARQWDAEVQALQTNFLSHATKSLSYLCQLQDLHLAVHERRQFLLSQSVLVEPDTVEPQDDINSINWLTSNHGVFHTQLNWGSSRCFFLAFVMVLISRKDGES